MPAAPASAAPVFRLGAVWTQSGGKNVVRVTGSAPLPDRTIIVLRVLYEDDEQHPMFVRRVPMKEGGFRDEIVDEQGDIVPGLYRVSAGVQDNQPAAVERILTPAQRGLSAATQFATWGRYSACAAVNQLAELIIKNSRAVHEEYPALAALASRALANSLDASEWKQWNARTTLGAAYQKLYQMAGGSRMPRRMLPRSIYKILDLIQDVGMLKLGTEHLLTLRAKGSSQAALDDVGGDLGAILGRPSTTGAPGVEALHATLFVEGRSTYAGNLERLADEVAAVYEGRSGKGPGDWDKLAGGWLAGLDELQNHFDDFVGLDWVMEPVARKDKSLVMNELLAAVRAYGVECGKALAGKAEALSQVQKLRDDIRRRFAGLERTAAAPPVKEPAAAKSAAPGVSAPPAPPPQAPPPAAKPKAP